MIRAQFCRPETSAVDDTRGGTMFREKMSSSGSRHSQEPRDSGCPGAHTAAVSTPEMPAICSTLTEIRRLSRIRGRYSLPTSTTLQVSPPEPPNRRRCGAVFSMPEPSVSSLSQQFCSAVAIPAQASQQTSSPCSLSRLQKTPRMKCRRQPRHHSVTRSVRRSILNAFRLSRFASSASRHIRPSTTISTNHASTNFRLSDRHSHC